MDFSYISIPLIIVAVSQAVKLATDKIKGNFDLKNLLSFYGGMPSSHTAFAVSITTLVGLRLGFDSGVFGVALVFTLLVMRDAIALRNIIGQQSVLLNRYRRQLPETEQAGVPVLREKMGHSAIEVAAGAALGIILTWILSLI
jgi:acid phosphatase family membrane protein YuiD